MIIITKQLLLIFVKFEEVLLHVIVAEATRLTWVDSINILRAIFCQYPLTKKSQSQNVTREKLLETLLYKNMCVKH